MVSILPPKRSPVNLIGESLSKFGQNLPNTLEERFQKERGLGAITELEKSLGEAGGDINKILPALAKAVTMNPQLERSGIIEQYLNRMQKTNSTQPVANIIDQISGKKNPVGMQATQAAQAGFQNQQQPQQAQPPQQQQNQQLVEGGISRSQTQGFQQKAPSGIPGSLSIGKYIDFDLGELITPEQKSKIINQGVADGGDAQLIRQQIDDYNSGKINQNELLNSNVDKQSANVKRLFQYEDEINKRLDKQLPEDTPQAEKNVIHGIVRNKLAEPGVESFTEAYQDAIQEINGFRKLNENYSNSIPEADMYGIPEGKDETLRNSAKPIMKLDPQAYDVLEEDYVLKGHSPITPAKILKPLPKPMAAHLSKAGDYNKYIYPMFSGFGMNENAMQRNIDYAQENQQKEIPELAKGLRGTWDKELSVLNIYADLKAKGWMRPNITTLLDDVADLFTPRQKADRALLNNELRVPARYLGFFGGNEE